MTAVRLEKEVSKIGTLGQGLLADVSVQKEVLRDYLRRLRAFWNHCEENQLSVERPEEADLALTHYANQMFKDG
eukprot:7569986-Karenia_brevis.AAC.1